ncbi:MAG: hypothetical protein Q9190_004820 [Brigantiaea leucoxantha]
MPSNVKNSLVYAFPGSRVVPTASLVDRSMTFLAQAVDIKTITSQSVYFNLPLHLKEHILSYIAAYRPQGLTSLELQALLVDPDQSHGSMDRSPSEIQSLDLSRSIGSRISFNDLSRTCAFPSLTRLCLAHPGPEISWYSFITFAEEIPNLTHLSLAYWPMPTEKSGDSFVSPLCLRRLSEALTLLKYLDVEGCNIWRFALLMFSPSIGIDWAGPWKHVESLNLSQGPMPVEVSLEGGPGTKAWIQGEVMAKRIEAGINSIRKTYGMPNSPLLHVEHGWNSENFMIRYVVDKAYERLYAKRSSMMTVSYAPDALTVQSVDTNTLNS